MAIWKFSAREMKSRPGRAFLTLFSVVLGVAAVVSVTIATSTTRAAFKQMFTAMTGSAALEIGAEVGGPFEQGVIEEVEKLPGVKAATPVLQRPTIMYYTPPANAAKAADAEESEGSKSKRVKLLAIGVDPEKKEDSLRDYALVDGKLFDEGEGVLLTTDFAKDRGLKVGDEVRLLAGGIRPTKVTLVGLLSPRANVLNQGIVILPLDQAQKLFKLKDQVHAIYVTLNDDNQVKTVEASINAILPAGLAAHPPASRTQQADEIMLSSEQGLYFTSAVTLLMAGFIIFNTFYMNVGERRRQLATMRALGATRSQLQGMLLREGFLLGVVGTALGIGLGLVGAHLVTNAMEGVFQIELSALQLQPWVFVLAIVFGLGISFSAAYLPAYLAGRVTPLEGMRAISTEEVEGVPVQVTWAGCAILAVCVPILFACMKGYVHIDHSVAAAAGIVWGLTLLIPTVLEPLSKFAGMLISPFLRVEAKLAVRQILRRRVRGTMTVGILFIAITVAIGIGNNMMSRVRDVKNWYRDTLVSDFFVRVAMPDMTTGAAPSMPAEIDPEIRAIPGVKAIDTIRYFSGKINDVAGTVVARDFTLSDEINLQVRSGDKDQLREKLMAGEAALGTVLAQRAKVKVGDLVTLTTDTGTHELRVAATVNEYFVGGLVLYVATPAAKKLLDIEGVDAYSLKAADGHRAEVEKALHALCDKHEVMMQSTAEISDMIDRMVGGVIGALWVTLALSFIVAAFGVVNTLTMNVLEQTREIGMLRVIAMTRNQVRKSILAQAAIVGIVGLVPGLATGLLIAYLLNVIMPTAFGYSIKFEPFPLMMAQCFFGGMIIILIAAWLPARRAAYLDLTTAMRRE